MKSLRSMLYALVVLSICFTLASCSTPAPASAPTAAPAPAQPAATAVSAAPAATEAPKPTEAPTAVPAATQAPAAPGANLQGPIPYPDPPKIDVGGAPINRQPISDIVAYKALPSYSEPAWVTDLVTAGKLPAVKDRLPKEPQVVLKSGMATGIGVYGDVGRFFSACPTAGWNFMAGTTAGWFGIESYSYNYQGLTKTGPLWRAATDVEPFPGLAKSWEWSADGTQLTMHLIEGAKWSDGQPFTADDVIFTWEDYIVDPNVNSWIKSDAFKFGGKDATLEKVDDYTIKWTFGGSKPPVALYQMAEQNFDVMPAHIFKPLHPKYNSKTDYKAFANAQAPQDLPQVTMGPWVAVEYKTDQLLVMRRNPYFWKVDETGQQLPYMDEIDYQKGTSGAGRSLCVIAGGCDQDNLENPSVFTEALQKAQDPKATYAISWGPETLGYYMQINQSADLGTKTDADKAMRQLFRDVNFRRALSQAIDRDGIAQSIMRGPFLRAWAGGVYPGAPEFDKSSVVFYPYSVDTSKALLAQFGFKDTDGNGIVNWTTGPLSGQDLTISMFANQDQQEAVNTAEALVNQLGQVGIKVNFRPVTSEVDNNISQSGEWDTRITRGGQEFALPNVRCTAIAPLTKAAPSWHREGTTPRQLQPFEKDLNDIVNKYCVETKPATRKDLLNQYNKVFTQNLYNIGIFVGRYGESLAKRFQNINPGLPAFLYNWTEDADMLEQVWTPAAQQVKQVRPNTIPLYTK